MAWRCGLSPFDSANTAAFSPRNCGESFHTGVDDFGAAARRAADACAPRATAHLAPRNLVDAARRTAAAAGDALLEELRDRARVKKATPLGALPVSYTHLTLPTILLV